MYFRFFPLCSAKITKTEVNTFVVKSGNLLAELRKNKNKVRIEDESSSGSEVKWKSEMRGNTS